MACYKITDPRNGDTKTSGVPFTVTFEAPCVDNPNAVYGVTGSVPPPGSVSVGLIIKTAASPTVCVNDCVYTVLMTVSLMCPCDPQQVTIRLFANGTQQDSVMITVVCP